MTLGYGFDPTAKGHFCSLLVSNIICLSSLSTDCFCMPFSTSSATPNTQHSLMLLRELPLFCPCFLVAKRHFSLESFNIRSTQSLLRPELISMLKNCAPSNTLLLFEGAYLSPAFPTAVFGSIGCASDRLRIVVIEDSKLTCTLDLTSLFLLCKTEKVNCTLDLTSFELR